MKPNSDRQSAIVVSKVKDLSKISNPPDWVGMFAVITPWGPELTPTLIKDVEVLDATFGDPRIDPDKYRDLYVIRDIINAGIACYVTRVHSGSPTSFSVQDGSGKELFNAITSLNGTLKLTLRTISVKPDSISLRYLEITLSEIVSTDNPEVAVDITSAKIALSSDTKNSEFIAVLNNVLGSYLNFSLAEGEVESETDIVEYYLAPTSSGSWTPTRSAGSFVVDVNNYIKGLELYSDPKYSGNFISELVSPVSVVMWTPPIKENVRFINTTNLQSGSANFDIRAVFTALSDTDDNYKALGDKSISFTRTNDGSTDTLSVTIGSIEGSTISGNKININGDTPFTISFQQLGNDGEWADLADTDNIMELLPVSGSPYTGTTVLIDRLEPDPAKVGKNLGSVYDLTSADRRSLHYHIKTLASQRLDLTCVFAPPYGMDYSTVCNWVSSSGPYSDLWEYGTSSAVAYADQSFYCEMYWDWVNWKVTKLVNNAASSVYIKVTPSGFVIRNSLLSFREKGVSFPVAGEQNGILPEEAAIISNPKTKAIRDQLVQYRINPIFDTGTRGVQIYGNETLNPSWSDLSAAHIARMLVVIRHRVHEFTETCKFMLNGVVTWQYWKNTVSTTILGPLQSEGGLNWYEVKMGIETTTPEEIAARIARGQIRLQFVPDCEVFDLEFVVESSAANLE